MNNDYFHKNNDDKKKQKQNEFVVEFENNRYYTQKNCYYICIYV